MKVLYIARKGIGVGGANDKIISQIKAFNQNGVICKGLFFDTDLKDIYEDTKNNSTYYPIDINNVPKIYSYPIFWRFHLNYEQKQFYKKVKEVIENMQYDFIFFRYDFADIHFLRFVKKFGQKIFIEYNSIPEKEFKKQSIYSHRDTYRYYCESFFSKKVIRKVQGVVGVTDEITNHQKNKQRQKIAYTLSNGIDVETFPLKQYLKYDGTILNLLILTGYVSDRHGVDRILKSIQKYQGKTTINFYIIGKVNQSDKILSKDLDIDNQVFFIDFLEKEKITNLFNQIHLGVGSMALFKADMKEASPLKVRDFLSRGVPFFYAYEDTDLNKYPEMSNYFLKFQNDDSLINMQKVIDFFEPILKDEKHIEKIRNYALTTVDYQYKIQQFISFLKTI
ncbi:MAG: hypothetical protein EAZ44_00470 [Cytophagia bacterium]|nr:MAG: hypothetical protein EAZ44_00470 [Cytophagia bacterium]